MQKALEKLNRELLGNVCVNESMSLHTSFRTGGPADIFIKPETPEDIKTALLILSEERIPSVVIGNGSNILVRDGGIRGAVVQLGAGFGRIAAGGERIRAEAGALLSAVAQRAAEESLSGLEFASGIPGSLGGGIFMNAGAYDGEIGDALYSVTVMDKNLNIFDLPAEDLDLGYRQSNIEERGLLILKCDLCLKRGNKGEIFEKMKELNRRRRDRQPLNYPSAGSVFKRPEGLFAGKLISDCGLKGKKIGGAEVSEKHAGFIINSGGASSRDIQDLIGYCQWVVSERFGVKLVPEIRVLGEE